MYQALAREYNPNNGSDFLLRLQPGGVRSLAGLLYRCGLPASRFAENDEAFRRCFAEAYAAYEPHCEDWVRIDR
jgi:hypothetical protein